MPKQKSNSSAKKRFRVLPSGKVKRGCQGKNHCLNVESKNRKTIRNLNKGSYVSDAEAKTIRTLVQK